MSEPRKLAALRSWVQDIYRAHSDQVPYHGWHHVDFVVQKSMLFLPELLADETFTIAAAYVHDFNYLVTGNSDEKAGLNLRYQALSECGFDDMQIERIENIVMEARTGGRHQDISQEAKALSDADTAYKALPVTPLMTVLYLSETGRSLRQLASKIVTEQTPLRQQGIYFYSMCAQATFGGWADANLELWTRVLDSLDSPDVIPLLEEMKILQ